MASKKITVFNPTTAPVVFTEDGRTIGGGERREVDALDSVGQHLLDSGGLIDVTPQPEDRDETASEPVLPRAAGRPEGAKKATTSRSGASDQVDSA